MFYRFDAYGWYDGCFEEQVARTTDIAPVNLSMTTVNGEMRANHTGYEWIDRPYFAPAVQYAAAKITKEAFRTRYTSAEKIANELISIDFSNPQRAAEFRVAIADQREAKFIDLNSPSIAAFVQMQVNAGVLTAERATEILTAAPTPLEKYTP